MADIPVEPTPPMPLWAALLGLLAIAGVVWVLFEIGSGGATEPAGIAESAAYASR